jgi:hypothetical protein
LLHLLFGSALAVDETTLTGMFWVSGLSLIAMGLIYKPCCWTPSTRYSCKPSAASAHWPTACS